MRHRYRDLVAEEQVGDAIRAEEDDTFFFEHVWEPVEPTRFQEGSPVSVDDQIGVALDLVSPVCVPIQ